MNEPSSKNRVIFHVGYWPNGTAKCPFAGSAVRPLQTSFVVVFTLLKWDHTIKGEEPIHVGVKVTSNALVRLDAHHSGCSKVGLPSSAAAQIAGTPARLIINNPVADGCLDCAQIGGRKMIPKLRKIIVARVDPGSEDSLGHLIISMGGYTCLFACISPDQAAPPMN